MSFDTTAARRRQQGTSSFSSSMRTNPPLVNVNGLQLIPPNNPFARAVIGSDSRKETDEKTPEKPVSNLTLLLNQELYPQQNDLTRRLSSNSSNIDEADSASEPTIRVGDGPLGSSAPNFFQNRVLPADFQWPRLNSLEAGPVSSSVSVVVAQSYRVRRYVLKSVCHKVCDECWYTHKRPLDACRVKKSEHLLRPRVPRMHLC